MAKGCVSLFLGFVFGLGFVGAMLASPQGNVATRGGVTLHGRVQTKDGHVIPTGVTVTLETRGGVLLRTRPTDSSGFFEFDGLVPGYYTLSVKAERFRTFEETLDLSNGWIAYNNVNVVLTPLEKPAVNLAALPSLTDQAAPKSARKEFEKGSHAWRENQPAEARKHLEKAIKEYPCYARAQAALAEVNVAERRLESAEAGYKQAIHCDGSYLDAFHQLAQLYMTENKPADSAAILREALRLSPGAWLFHYQLGTAQFALGEYPGASQDFLAAQSLHPDMPAEFHAKLANTYLKMAEYAKALAEIDTYLRLSPDGPYATSAKKISQVLRSGGVTDAGPRTDTPSAAQP